MTRFLAGVRRLFLSGIVSLLIALIGMRISFPDLMQLAKVPQSIEGIFSLFLVLSPVLYILFMLISSIYFRHFGQSAEVHKQKVFLYSILAAVGSDLLFPF